MLLAVVLGLEVLVLEVAKANRVEFVFVSRSYAGSKESVLGSTLDAKAMSNPVGKRSDPSHGPEYSGRRFSCRAAEERRSSFVGTRRALDGRGWPRGPWRRLGGRVQAAQRPRDRLRSKLATTT